MKYRSSILSILLLFLAFPLGGCAKSAPQNVAQCGDGKKQASEECDEGDNNDAPCPYGATECETCSSECKIVRGETSFCGDNILQDNQEECDATALTAQCDYGLNNCLVCDASCRFTAGLTSFCGDGTTDTANGEACDRGAEPETCDYGATNCTLCGSDCQFFEAVGGFCGDGILQEAHEACDDGNTISGDYCQADCQAQTGYCGDQTIQNNEVCDDGNTDNGDYCRNDCGAQTGSCGDHILQSNEVCDDGNTENGDYCNSDCTAHTGSCGDGTQQSNEVCDDSNNQEGDYCSADCASVTGSCGDGLRQSIEMCDDGNTDNGDYCSDDCQTVTGRCGDEIIQDIETCDDGNTVGDDYCSMDCLTITGACGDTEQQPNEACDDGNTVDGDYCAGDCRSIIGACGDNEEQTNEVCDDGNTDEGDYCSADCQAIIGACGDGEEQTNEVCDDENTDDGDYCAADCLTITGYCGDSEEQTNEACDDGNTEDGDYCAADCLTVTGYCGDNLQQSNEACDDGNDSNSDNCLNTCEAASCGDGYLHIGQEDCDTAIAGDLQNADCFACTMYCHQNDEAIYLNHNGDYTDGCEEVIYAFETGPGQTAMQFNSIAKGADGALYSAGTYSGSYDSRTTPANDGILQKRDAQGHIAWEAYLYSETPMLPTDDSFSDSLVAVTTTENQVIAAGHYCEHTDDNIGTCIGLLMEGNSHTRNDCVSDDECEEGRTCNITAGKCGKKFSVQTTGGERNGLVVSLDPQGGYLWSARFLSGSLIELRDIKQDANNNVYVIGAFRNTLTLVTDTDENEQEYTGDGSNRAGFVAQFSSTGALNWFKQMNHKHPYGLAINHATSNGAFPQVAVGGIENADMHFAHGPFLNLFEQDENGLQSQWFLADRIFDYKNQYVRELQFDEEGGLWLTGVSGRQRADPVMDYDFSFGTCEYTTSLSDSVLIFNGNGHVSLPETDNLGYNDSFTVAGWFLVSNAQTGPHTIWGAGEDWQDSHMLYIQSGKLRFQRCYNDPGCGIGLTSTTDIESDTWYHFAFTREGDDAKFYINGTLDSEGGNSNWNTPALNTPAFLGRRSADSQAFFMNGQLDDLGFWNRALASHEVSALSNRYTLFHQNLRTGLRAFFDMTASDDGQLISEFSGYDGTLISTSAPITNATATYVCREASEACPSLVNLSTSDSCAEAFECARPCYDGAAEELDACIQNCSAPLEGTEAELFEWLIDAIANYTNCNGYPSNECIYSAGGSGNSYQKCMMANADTSFVAHYTNSGECTFNQIFYNEDPWATDITPTKTSGLDVVGESALTSVYDSSSSTPSSSTLSLISYDQVLEGGGHVIWTSPFASSDQTPAFVLDILLDDAFLYFSARYQSLEEMSLEVDYVAEQYLTHTACSFEDSCDDTALVVKTRLDDP